MFKKFLAFGLKYRCPRQKVQFKEHDRKHKED